MDDSIRHASVYNHLVRKGAIVDGIVEIVTSRKECTILTLSAFSSTYTLGRFPFGKVFVDKTTPSKILFKMRFAGITDLKRNFTLES